MHVWTSRGAITYERSWAEYEHPNCGQCEGSEWPGLYAWVLWLQIGNQRNQMFEITKSGSLRSRHQPKNSLSQICSEARVSWPHLAVLGNYAIKNHGNKQSQCRTPANSNLQTITGKYTHSNYSLFTSLIYSHSFCSPSPFPSENGEGNYSKQHSTIFKSLTQ